MTDLIIREPFQYNSKLLEYVQQYSAFCKEAALHTIEKCVTLVEAQQNLTVAEFEEFCERIKLSPKSSTIRKYRTIGRAADRLKLHADRLPDNWTTLYELAKMRPEQLDRLATSGELHPSMTADDLKAVASKTIQSEKSCYLRLDIGGVGEAQQFDLYQELNQLAGKYGAIVSGWRNELIAEFETKAHLAHSKAEHAGAWS